MRRTYSINDPSGHGMSNPVDEREREYIEPRELFFGEWLTKDEFIEKLNKMIGGRSAFTVDEHEDNMLYLRIPFECGEDD